MNKLVPCACLLSGALEIWSLRLRLSLRLNNSCVHTLTYLHDLLSRENEIVSRGNELVSLSHAHNLKHFTSVSLQGLRRKRRLFSETLSFMLLGLCVHAERSGVQNEERAGFLDFCCIYPFSQLSYNGRYYRSCTVGGNVRLKTHSTTVHRRLGLSLLSAHRLNITNLRATKGGGTHPPKVFSMSHFLLLE